MLNKIAVSRDCKLAPGDVLLCVSTRAYRRHGREVPRILSLRIKAGTSRPASAQLIASSLTCLGEEGGSDDSRRRKRHLPSCSSHLFVSRVALRGAVRRRLSVMRRHGKQPAINAALWVGLGVSGVPCPGGAMRCRLLVTVLSQINQVHKIYPISLTCILTLSSFYA